jgi:alpha-beta hydrolase superfamily lysophospholipase
MAGSAEKGRAFMRDGTALRTYAWPAAVDAPARGVVLLVHGLGEHAGRYAHVARHLNDWGWKVQAYDQFGHGESPGKPGTLTTPTRLLDDLADMVDRTRAAMPPAQSLLLLLGHSMGGAVVADFVAQGIREVQGLVLSSPALDAGMSGAQRALAAVLARAAPGFTIGNGLQAERISRDPAEVAAYRADPRVHDRISGRLAHYIASAGPRALAETGGWRLPTLLLYAGSDALVDPAGSRRFAAAAPPAAVTACEFPAHYHEIFNEIERAPVFDALRAWLDARFP